MPRSATFPPTASWPRPICALEPGAIVWLKLPGLEPQNSKVIWAEEGKIGFQFTTPVHPATIELVVAMSRKPVPKRHFGPQDRPAPRSIA